MQITLNGIPPSKKNSRRLFRTRNGKIANIPSIKYNVWEYNAVMLAKVQCKPFAKDSRLKLTVHIGRSQKIRRDLDNILSSVCDMLVKAGIVADDRLDIICSMSIDWSWSKEKEYTRIDLHELS